MSSLVLGMTKTLRNLFILDPNYKLKVGMKTFIYIYSSHFRQRLFLLANAWCTSPKVTQSNNNRTYYPDLEFVNKSYRESIKTVQLIHFSQNKMVSTDNPVIELGSSDRLLLYFR